MSDMNEQERLGQFLRQLRLDLPKENTLRDFADALEQGSPQTISNWERGYQLLPAGKLAAVKKIYGIITGSQKENEFDRLYSDAERKKTLSTGPLSLEDDQGVKPMVDGLQDLASLARQDKESRYILHSISNQGFLTERYPDLQAAVVDCACAGVDVVFFPQPGEESAANAEANLKMALRKGVENYAHKHEHEGIDSTAILNCLSLLTHKHFPPTISAPEIEEWADEFVTNQVGQQNKKCVQAVTELVECVSSSAVWLGSFLRFLVEIKVAKSSEKRIPPSGGLDRTCPVRFQVTKIWLHFVTYNAGLKVKRHAWLPIINPGSFSDEYELRLSILRKNNLLKSSLIFKPKP